MSRFIVVSVCAVFIVAACGSSKPPSADSAEAVAAATPDAPPAPDRAAPADAPDDPAPAVAPPPAVAEAPAQPAAPTPPAPIEASKARITDKHIVISGKILFKPGKAVIKRESHPILDDVATALEKHPEIIKISIDGHTDDDGNEKANKRLSKRRANAVRKYLVDVGIEKDRMTTFGYGEEVPIASNDTDEGKRKNRRVEFTIIERAPIAATTFTSSSTKPGQVKSRAATADETEAVIEKEGLE